MSVYDWALKRDDVVLGYLTDCRVSQPVFHCKFRPTAEFESVKHLFDRELALLNENRMDEYEAAYDEIDELGLHLSPPEGQPIISEFLLHIEGDAAWFRY